MTSAEYSIDVASLRSGKPARFAHVPEAPQRQTLADTLDVQAIRKLRFDGEITPHGRRGWALSAKLGATVVQSCIVTLDPVTTRIDTPVTRLYLPAAELEQPEDGAEHEIPEEDGPEPLGSTIDLWAVITEELALALPDYPRKPDADLGSAQFAEPGTTPLRDEDTRPFAGLAGLRDKIAGNQDPES